MKETKLEENLRKFAEVKNEINNLSSEQENVFSRFLKDIGVSEESEESDWLFDFVFNSCFDEDFQKRKLEELLK